MTGRNKVVILVAVIVALIALSGVALLLISASGLSDPKPMGAVPSGAALSSFWPLVSRLLG